MTKSRTLRAMLPAALLLPLPAIAQAPVSSMILTAPPDPLGDIAARARTAEERCRDADPDSIVVCGRLVRGGEGYRVPYEPEPGARVHLVAGEAPSATGAMGAGGCLRLCHQPVTIDLIGAARAIGRGIDRLLHPD